MKIPTTFAWLSAAVLTAMLAIFGVARLMSTAGLPVPAPLPFTAPAAAPSSGTSAGNRIQIAFLLDTSSSMDGLIDQAKARLWNILNEILKAEKDGETPDIEVALYQYGNTGLLPEKGFIQQVTPLTTDVDLISKALFALTTSGGDEFCGHVIQTATKELQWEDSDNTVKLIYIAGNESFNQGTVAPPKALTDARNKGIVVNTIFCGNPNSAEASSWRTNLTAADGDFFFINQDEQVVYIESPHDDEIERINGRLNQTYVPIGTQGVSLKANQNTQDANAASYGKANLSSRVKFKASKKYKAAEWDLVDAYEAEPTRLVSEKTTLPDSLRTLSDEALRLKVVAIKAEREALRDQLQAVTAQRDTFVAQARKNAAGEQANTLGEKLNASVRKELVKKQYVVKE